MRRKGDDSVQRGRQIEPNSAVSVPAYGDQPRIDLPSFAASPSGITQSLLAEKTAATYDPSPSTDRYSTPMSEATSLQELAHYVRLSRYQERKRATVRIRLERTLISTALNARLIRCGELGHRSLVENFRRDDKDGFAALYSAIQDVRKSCDELRRYALLEPDLEAQSSPVLGSSECLDDVTDPSSQVNVDQPVTSFLDTIAPTSKEQFLKFLSQIRTNPDYLAARLAALSSSELGTMLQAHKGFDTMESVLSSSRSSSRTQPNNSTRNGMSDVEKLLSFQRHDPLSILIHTCFANSAGPGSNEDLRRTDVWATALARLISEPKSSSEHFLIRILNTWTMMRDWAGKSNMEWFLMKILSDGAFLLERAEDQHGTRFNLANWNRSDEAAADKFYSRAVTELFELVANEDGTGIPDGLLELGTAVLKKLDGKYVDNTSKWLVWRCLFFVFFLGVIVHPESHGMLSQYYITPYAREKILKKVAIKAHEYVSNMWSAKANTPAATVEIPAHIKTHIENILDRFQGGQSNTTKLQPAKSVTSLRETAEVHPFILVCPADISTLINALFPERRPLSSASSGLRSNVPSLSALSALSNASQPVSMVNPKSSMETGSVIGTSVSSIFSDNSATNDANAAGSKTVPERFSPANETEQQRKSNRYEDDGFQLRLALHEMGRTLGNDVVRGTCHPCADTWAIIFTSSDGKKLTTRMTYDVDLRAAAEETGSSTATEDTCETERDREQLRESILKLVEEYEIPRSADDNDDHSHLTYRTSPDGKNRSETRPIMPELAHLAGGARQVPQFRSSTAPARVATEQESVLITMLQAAYSQAKSQSDFISSHMYWDALNHLQTLYPTAAYKAGYSDLVHSFSREPRDSIQESTYAIEEYDAWLVWLKQSQERLERLINRMMRRVRAIRDKMWYVADVRNSTEYAYARDTCQGLKFMGMPQRWSSSQGSWTTANRGSGPAYLYWTESQVIELLAASKSHGGPNKLTDDQAEITATWLKNKGVENLCRGEERIHRFCCELDKYISQLVGENIREAPVLWSSELYRRDKHLYDQTRRQGLDRRPSADDASSFLSDASQPYSATFKTSNHNRRLSSNGRFQSPFDSPRHGQLRSAVPFNDVLDGQDYLDRTSPVHANHLPPTFWSPFQPTTSSVRAYSPTTSMTNLSAKYSMLSNNVPVISPGSISLGRPETIASFNETIYHNTVDGDKASFLAQIKQTLTGLLISDLGNLVLPRGSETDQWFRKLGQECIERKQALDDHASRKAALKDAAIKTSNKPRALEKKKSFGDLRGAGENITEREEVDTGSEAGFFGDMSSSQRLATPVKQAPEFPFSKAYKRLLTMFCVHPNPYVKLSALRELEQLVTASIQAKKKRSRPARSKADRSTNGASKDVPSSAEITAELLKLFRDASIRPKHLFRDLQFISAFVPPSILDKQEQGQAFWNAGVAALQLKTEVCRTMIEMADEVFAAHTQTRSTTYEDGAVGSPAPSATGTPPPPSSKYNLYDVGRMWTITAKEGYPAAQRELALFYLSNPEFVNRSTLPLARPKEIFKPAVMAKFARSDKTRSMPSSQSGTLSASNSADLNAPAGAANGNGNTDDARNDPALMCVAIHWMEAAQSGGDGLAISFLHQNGYYEPLAESKPAEKATAME